ncbi:tRNA (guanosine(37)-N1)-methyltransferase TrmD [Thermosulfurimonas marina]|uniref:tRNA (guanine-N(1)-)-methyltransferase n=1 Tax=Thermosulfurimonas marina TaxID=2047767 RepID=A0A6H1WR68_9BACT|nr:tRNA (guanosine(37)-N1)-methyltransferase TrmD [Thermosulfurimonas marina]QJA05636.1 tRNA (guanosine(37)-N1)-methyltransferase TrmD [Thermosulfurimonas marina]
MIFDILTIFPEYFESPLRVGLLGKALERGLLKVRVHNLRDFATDKHRTVDDKPFGGGEGMLFKPEPLYRALEALRAEPPSPWVIYLSPQGRRFNHRLARELSRKERLVLLCGRYEGIDERIRAHFVDEELSIGDYVLFGGEVAALVVLEAVARWVPGVVGCEDSVKRDSFAEGLLKHPQYTRPREFLGYRVPEVLLSGDHARVERWRRERSLEITFERRPDLLREARLSPEDRAFLRELFRKRVRLYLALVHYPVINKEGRKIASSFTNLDLHDIARLARTYGVRIYYLVQPLADQRAIVEELLRFWLSGPGARHNPDRVEALKLVKLVRGLEEALADIEAAEGERPLLLATDAQVKRPPLSWEEAACLVRSGRPVLLLLGTAWGLAPEVLSRADYFLEPIFGPLDEYNHLSVRSAASIILDRLLREVVGHVSGHTRD